jgi:alpha-galactosidase
MRLTGFIVGLMMVTGLLAQQPKPFHQWAATPPMGWNSWDCFGPTVTESEVKANVDYMAANLKQYGWEYIIVDIRWFVSNDKANGYNQTNPQYNIDAYGRFTPAVNRFPSAANGKGFKPLADYIHSKGLKFGIHIMRGVPVQAVKNNLPILHSHATAKDIYSANNQCTWLRDMYSIEPGKNGAQEYYNSIFKLYAGWGVDFVKVDDLSSPIYFASEVEMIRKAIEKTGRKILLSTSPGETPLSKAAHVQQHANMWRTVGDFWDSWLQLKEHFAVFERWNAYRQTGAWPDGDMLPLGHIGIRAERGANRMSNFTRDEQQTLMTLWAIFKSPLMFGGHLPDNDAYTQQLLTNKELLYVLKHSTNNQPLFSNQQQAAWLADDPATGDKFLAVFNIADQQLAVDDKALWKSVVINRQNTVVPIDININGASKLYLVVKDAGDNIEWDHANWINPRLHNSTDSVSLTTIKWVSASTGWGSVQLNKSVSGGPLSTNGISFHTGIGTHANSVIEFDIPAGYSRFTALLGLDAAAAEQNTGASMQGLLYTQNPAGPGVPAQDTIHIALQQLDINGPVTIKNIWTGENLGTFSKSFSPVINQHGCGMYRITKQ